MLQILICIEQFRTMGSPIFQIFIPPGKSDTPSPPVVPSPPVCSTGLVCMNGENSNLCIRK